MAQRRFLERDDQNPTSRRILSLSQQRIARVRDTLCRAVILSVLRRYSISHRGQLPVRHRVPYMRTVGHTRCDSKTIQRLHQALLREGYVQLRLHFVHCEATRAYSKVNRNKLGEDYSGITRPWQ